MGWSGREPDDYDVMSGDQTIGRISKEGAAFDARPWRSTITGAVIPPWFQTKAFAATRGEAILVFAATWRAYLKHIGSRP